MDNIIFIFLFITSFLFIIGILYSLLLRNEELKKRLTYYLDIENKYRRRKAKKTNFDDIKDILKNSNEIVREIMKKGLPDRNQKKISQMLKSSGINIKPEEYIMFRFLTASVAGGLFYVLFSSIYFLLIGLIGGYFVPKVWVNFMRRKRVDKFNDGLPDMITTIISSLKSGYSFSQAMKTVAEESEAPVKEEIETLINEMTYGITLDEALNNLNRRMPSKDLELMIHATLIQRQIGGNLSTILEIISNTIRERKKIERHVRTLTAQGRLSGKIISMLPVLILFVTFYFNKSYLIEFLSNKYGLIAMGYGFISCIIGFIIINRITKIEV